MKVWLLVELVCVLTFLLVSGVLWALGAPVPDPVWWLCLAGESWLSWVVVISKRKRPPPLSTRTAANTLSTHGG